MPAGVDVHLGQQSEGWAHFAGGDLAYTGLLTFGFDLELETLGLIDGAFVEATGLFVQGGSITDDVGDAGVISNLAGVQTVRLFRAAYAMTIAGAKAKVGILALDDDFMVVDRALLFVNSGFGTLQTLALNLPTPIYPLGALGARVIAAPVEGFEVRAGVYDGDAGAEADHRYVSNLALSRAQGVTAVAEVAFRDDTTHVALGALTHRAASPLEVIYVMGEHRIAPALWVIAHASIALPLERAVAQVYSDVGLVLDRTPWRDHDNVGLGVAWTHFGSPYVQTQRPRVTAAEIVTELTYRAPLTDWLAVQASLQWLIDAHVSGEDALVAGLRVDVIPF